MPSIVAELRASTTDFMVKMGEARAEVAKLGTESSGHLQKLQTVGKAAFLGLAGGAIAFGVESIKMGADFQKSTNLLVTAAGESQKNLGLVRDGILSIARETGTSTEQLSEGMYQIEKAGIRGADGLTVLRAASQGAAEEGANLSTVTSAMTSVMSAYNIPAGQAVQVMNAIKTGAGGAKTTMEAYAGSLSTVIPVAAKVGVGFDQVAGAMAGLTRNGVSADQATQDIVGAIRNLSAPLGPATKQMQQLGINSVELSNNLGKHGLANTMQDLVNVITSKMGPAGLIIQDTMRKSASASQDMTLMLKQMSPAAQKLAQDLMSNTISVKEYRKETGKMAPDQLAMARQFATLSLQSKGFSDVLKRGGPEATTFIALLKTMMGGSQGLNTALALTGSGLAYTTEMTKKTAASMNDGAKSVEGWDSTSKLFSIQLAKLKEDISTLAIKIGMDLIPIVTSIVDWFTKHRQITIDLGVAVLAVVGFLALYGAATFAVTTAMKVATVATEAWKAATWLLNFALDANPIGAVILVIVGLTGSVVYAYEHFKTFRDIVNTVWQDLQKTTGTAVQIMIGLFKMWLDVWMAVVGGILDGAAKAFGWVPGVGGKLKAAAKGFDEFRDAANSKLSQIADDASRWGAQAGANMGGQMTSAFNATFSGLQAQGATFIQSVTAAGAASKLAKYADGGTVSGPTGAAQLAIVHGGEVVLNPNQQEGMRAVMGSMFRSGQASGQQGGSAGSVVVAPGAVQVTFTGPVDSGSVGAVNAHIDRAFEALRARLTAA